jgi:hypothetical protein
MSSTGGGDAGTGTVTQYSCFDYTRAPVNLRDPKPKPYFNVEAEMTAPFRGNCRENGGRGVCRRFRLFGSTSWHESSTLLS